MYQNTSKTVTLLDIPQSIALAQGTSDNPSSGTLYSTPAIEKPWPSTEPKSEKAKANVASHGMIKKSSTGEEELVQQALEELTMVWTEPWCLERKIKWDIQEPNFHVPAGSPGGWKSLEPLILEDASTAKFQPQDLQDRAVSNPSQRFNSLLVITGSHPDGRSSPAHSKPTYYLLPPSSTFILSQIRYPDNGTFSMAALTLLPGHSPSPTCAGPGQFDFILLDPPWPNRSARRSKPYSTPVSNSFYAIEGLKCTLGPHIAPKGGVVACWISNSASARAKAMEMFSAWDVDIVEEWCWVKVTRGEGRAVTGLGSVWRRAWEVLLIGRRRVGESNSDDDDDREKRRIKRRVIAAVPDVHSRKPSVKVLIEEAFGFQAGEYRALEVFARNLTAGWWGWGDECLRFQWEGWWVREDDDEGGEMEEEQEGEEGS